VQGHHLFAEKEDLRRPSKTFSSRIISSSIAIIFSSLPRSSNGRCVVVWHIAACATDCWKEAGSPAGCANSTELFESDAVAFGAATPEW
jgi:hypothetical protein|tara:strand:+ start:402 stop:668 length:267 start_codon:yes stop_codon:yes gene_type:complete